jgi:hypothetical protein
VDRDSRQQQEKETADMERDLKRQKRVDNQGDGETKVVEQAKEIKESE